MTATTNDGLLQTTTVGGETSIDFDFHIYTTADLEVIRTRGGADTTLVLTTDYTIAASELNDPTGGVITLTSAAVAGDIYTCRSNIQEARAADFQQGGDFFSATVNAEFDKIIRITQQLRRDLDRAVQISPTSTISPSSLPVTMDDPVAGSLLSFSSSGGIEPVTIASLGLSGLDTVLSSLAADDGLFWNGTNWVNSKVTPSKISTKQIPNGSIGTVASATTIVLNSTTTNYFNITGTTTITGITLAEGVEVTVKFAGALTLTNGANLINISGANITTAAGDIAVFRGEASGVVRMIDYVRASGAPVVTPSSGALVYLGSATASASATLDFTNGIDSTYDTYVFSFEKILLSTNASCYLRTSSNSGSSYDSGATDYRDYSGSLNFSSIQITGGPAQIPIINGFLYMYAPSSTSVKKDFFSSLLTKYTAGTTQTVSSQDLGGTRETTSAINAIRFFLSSGVFTSGTIRLYGVAKS